MADGHFVLGIDFGTSNSCVSIWRADKKYAKIIKNLHDPGSKITPSCITFGSVGFDDYIIGKPSADKTTVKGLKNLLGLTYKDLPTLKDLRSSLPTIHNQTNESENDLLEVECYDSKGNMQVFSVEYLVSLILSYLRTCAQTYLRKKPMRVSSKVNSEANIIYPNDPLTRVVLGIPANFTEKSRHSLRVAAEMAGFVDISFMIESTAAAMAYGLLIAGEKRVLVFDMGGGTTDISILRINNKKQEEIKAERENDDDTMQQVIVEYTGGCIRLGGQQIDQLVYKYVKEQLVTRYPCVSWTEDDDKKLLEESRQCKELLTSEERFTFELSWLVPSLPGYESVPIALTRTHFEEELLRDTVCVAIRDTLRHALRQCPPHEEVQEVVVVGGSSRVPCVQDTLRHTWHEHTLSVCRDTASRPTMKELCHSVDCERCVTEGLGIKGALLSQCIDSDDFVSRDTIPSKTQPRNKLKRWLMMDAVPHTIGILVSCTDDTDKDAHHYSGDNCKQQKYFEPVVIKSSVLPCVARYTAPYDTSARHRRCVTLDVYEEIEEVVVVSHEQDTCRVSYSYQLLRSVDVPIETRTWQTDSTDNMNSIVHDPDQVTVEFAVDTEGVLSYTVYRYVDATQPAADTHRLQDTVQVTLWLSVSLFLLIGMYIGLKYQAVVGDQDTVVHDSTHSADL